MRKFVLSLLAVLFIFASAPVQAVTEQELVKQLEPMKSILNLDRDQKNLAASLEKSLQYYSSLKNYRALFYKMEKAENKMGPTEKIFLKFEKPWKIYLEWLNTDKKGLQVVYERGRNDNKLAIHRPGLLSAIVPVIFLEQSSPWVRQGSASYNIEDAGIGTFLTDLTQTIIKAKKEKRLKVRYEGKYSQDGIKGDRWNVTFLHTRPNYGYFAYRVHILLDEQTALPVHFELFDWNNQTMGIYEYRNLKVDLASDPEFEKRIDGSLLRVYRHS